MPNGEAVILFPTLGGVGIANTAILAALAEALQKDALRQASCEKLVVDQVSGTVAEQPGLKQVQKPFCVQAIH